VWGREICARSRGQWHVETRTFARAQQRRQQAPLPRANLALPFSRLLE
jgi:hypothetical protein